MLDGHLLHPRYVRGRRAFYFFENEVIMFSVISLGSEGGGLWHNV